LVEILQRTGSMTSSPPWNSVF